MGNERDGKSLRRVEGKDAREDKNEIKGKVGRAELQLNLHNTTVLQSSYVTSFVTLYR